MTSSLFFSDVTRRFGAVTGLDHVTFSTEPGEIVGVLGPNGSGKSTLLMLAAGLLAADEGIITVSGNDVRERNPERMKKVGMLFDNSAHWDQLSAWDNAFFFARSYGVPEHFTKDRLHELFSAFGLSERSSDPVETFSFGMRRKLAVIEALAHAPDLLVLDEPSIGLDFSSRMILHTRLRKIAKEGATVIFATNDVYEAQALAHRVIIFSKGKITASGDPGDLIRELRAFTTIELRLGSSISPEVLHRVRGVEEIRVIEDSPGRYRVRILARDEENPGTGSSDLIARIATGVIESGGVLLGIECTEPNLGDVMAKTGGDANAS